MHVSDSNGSVLVDRIPIPYYPYGFIIPAGTQVTIEAVPDFGYRTPIVLPAGSTLADAAKDVHKDFGAKLKFARIWGSGKHDGVMVKREHVLQDGDIIELHM